MPSIYGLIHTISNNLSLTMKTNPLLKAHSGCLKGDLISRTSLYHFSYQFY